MLRSLLGDEAARNAPDVRLEGRIEQCEVSCERPNESDAYLMELQIILRRILAHLTLGYLRNR
jgi:hypothetical protein